LLFNFQKIFQLIIHQNNIFYYLKIIFDISIYQDNIKILKNINFKKIKNIFKIYKKKTKTYS